MIPSGTYLINLNGEIESVRNFQGVDKKDQDKIEVFQFSHELCLIHVKSGSLTLNGCSLYLDSTEDGESYDRFSFIYQMNNTRTFISRCQFKGGGPDKSHSTGIFLLKGSTIIQKCNFQDLRLGAVIADLDVTSQFIFRDNAAVTCSGSVVHIDSY